MPHQQPPPMQYVSPSALRAWVRACAYACTGALLAACSPFATPPAAQLPAPAADTTAMAATQTPAWLRRGTQALHIVPQESLLTITVRRGGALARLGHDHVIASRSLQGVVAPAQGRAAFQFRLDEMRVDEEGLRQAAGLTSTPSADAIAGTRHNMLVRVLDAERYPWVRVDARRAGDSALLDADITLHGVTRSVQLPVRIEETTDGKSLQASGSLLLKQSDFGIVPFAILGGAMAVQDQMELAFRITARRQISAPGSGASPGQ